MQNEIGAFNLHVYFGFPYCKLPPKSGTDYRKSYEKVWSQGLSRIAIFDIPTWNLSGADEQRLRELRIGLLAGIGCVEKRYTCEVEGLMKLKRATHRTPFVKVCEIVQ